MCYKHRTQNAPLAFSSEVVTTVIELTMQKCYNQPPMSVSSMVYMVTNDNTWLPMTIHGYQ